jgi:TolA-binding protein
MNRVYRQIWGNLGSGLLLASVLSACGTATATLPATPVAHKSDPVAPESSVVQSLQKQLREREKRIDELESQLNILKMIDQDVQVRRKPARTPATLTPSE